MTPRAKRNHKMEYGFSWYAMMNNDGTFASPRSSANATEIAISLQDLLSQPTKIFVILPFQGVAGCAKTERKNLLASASAIVPIPGTRSVDHLQENLRAVD